METYIAEALKQGFICPSNSHALAAFFVLKKDGGGGLRLGIDCRGLDEVTVKYKYPLPLVFSARAATMCMLFHQTGSPKCILFGAYMKGIEWKTTFSTTSGHYKYRVMLCGTSRCAVHSSSYRQAKLVSHHDGQGGEVCNIMCGVCCLHYTKTVAHR